jgi:hypothetical protein
MQVCEGLNYMQVHTVIYILDLALCIDKTPTQA